MYGGPSRHYAAVVTAGPIGGDPEAVQVLATPVRVRPGTVTELRAIRTLPLERLDAILAALERAGFVEVDGDRLVVAAPDEVLGRSAAALADLVGLVPTLGQEWQRGTSGPLEVEVVHGHEEQWRAWARHAELTPPRDPINLYPNLDVLRDVIAPDLESVVAAHAAGVRMRAVVPASTVVAADDRAVIATLERAGMQMRLVPALESWVYADRGVLCALPLTWAEHPPSSIMIARDPAITALVSSYAEHVWSTATPYSQPGAEPAERSEVLQMMGLGMSDQAIATALGTSMRTVQRRIAEALTHYGVGSRFELGAAWATAAVTASVTEQVDDR